MTDGTERTAAPVEPAVPAMDKLDAWLGAIQQAVPTPAQAEVRRLGVAIRQVIESMLSTEAPVAELAAAAEQVEALAQRLSSFPHGDLYHGLAGHEGAHPASFFDFAPLLGRANPVAPPLAISVVGGQVIGRARFGSAYEGPPGCVHGGFIAACFDDVLGLAQSVSEEVAMTGTLSVRYLAPTPLHAEVRFVGTMVGRSGRKIMTRGELWAPAGVRTAEADGVFITVASGLFERLRSDASDPPAT